MKLGAALLRYRAALCGLCLCAVIAGTVGVSTVHAMAGSKIDEFAQATAVKHSLELASVTELLAKGKKDQRVIDAYKRPAESKPWHQYRKIFLTDKRIKGGAKFWRENEATLARAEERYGVPASVIVAIIGVETFYGRYKGKIRVLDALMTLAFHDPKREKFFRRELEEFLLLSKEGSVDPLEVHGSYAGAMGVPQFIASSYRAYSVDFDGDGARDLVGSVSDAIGSVGAYLSRHGWVKGGSIAGKAKLSKVGAKSIAKKGYKPHTTLGAIRAAGVVAMSGVRDDARAALVDLDIANGKEYWIGLKNFYVITRYNHSPLYAMAVYQLSGEIEAAHN
jgi:membrane-bound lytic murein transglycosylase B